MQHLWQDIVYGLRLFWRKPGFTIAALASLVLGIGLNTAVFTLLDAIFLRPLPVEDPSSLATVYSARRDQSTGEYQGLLSHSHPNYLDLREQSESFEGLAMFQWYLMNFTGGSEPLRATGMFVSHNYFDVLGLRPAHGRFFLAEEDENPGSHPVVVLSHSCWSRFFGADPGAVGRTVEVNGHRSTVIGVAPRGFRGTDLTVDVDFWTPMMMFPVVSPYATWFDVRGVSFFRIFGRLADGVTPAVAEAELMAISRRLEEAFPKDDEGLGARIRPFLEGTFRAGQRDEQLERGKMLVVAALLILLISCLTVAHLLLVRGFERQREIAVRQSLGAGRGRLARQLLTENLTLFVIGGVLALPAGRVALDLLWRFRPPQFDVEALGVSLDLRVFSFAFLLSLASGLLFGVLPAWLASRSDLVGSLKENVPPALGGHLLRRFELRRVLVALQVALTLLALIGAGLLVRSLRNAYAIDVGFDAESLLSVSFAPGEQGYDKAHSEAFYERVLERTRALPGVSSATLSENRLLRGAILRHQVFLPGVEEALISGAMAFHRTNAVFPGFFETAGIPLVLGQDFDDSIHEQGPRVAIVNQTMAETAWPGEDPIGKIFHFDFLDTPEVRVIGVAQDAKYRNVHEEDQFFIYVPARQSFPSAATLHVRSEGDPASLLAAVADGIRELDPQLPLYDVNTMGWFVDEDLWKERVSATLLTGFGILALALATVGIYSVLAQAVNQRRREMGIRLAVGARRIDLLRSVFGEGAVVIAAGLVAGIVMSFVLFRFTSLVSNQLIGVRVDDPVTYLLASIVLCVVAFLGCLIPARRAAAIDPVNTLRDE